MLLDLGPGCMIRAPSIPASSNLERYTGAQWIAIDGSVGPATATDIVGTNLSVVTTAVDVACSALIRLESVGRLASELFCRLAYCYHG